MDKYNFVSGIAICKNSRLFGTRFRQKDSSVVDGNGWEHILSDSEEIGDFYINFPELAHYEKPERIVLVSDNGDIVCFIPNCIKVHGLGYIDGNVNAFNEFINCSDSVIFE